MVADVSDSDITDDDDVTQLMLVDEVDDIRRIDETLVEIIKEVNDEIDSRVIYHEQSHIMHDEEDDEV